MEVGKTSALLKPVQNYYWFLKIPSKGNNFRWIETLQRFIVSHNKFSIRIASKRFANNITHCFSWPSPGESRECTMKWFLLPPAAFWGGVAARSICFHKREGKLKTSAPCTWSGRSLHLWWPPIPRGIFFPSSGWPRKHPSLQWGSLEMNSSVPKAQAGAASISSLEPLCQTPWSQVTEHFRVSNLFNNVSERVKSFLWSHRNN